MRLIRKSRKITISVILVMALLLSVIACSSAVYAKDSEQPAPVSADNYYLWGLNTNDPDFGAMTAPTGSFAYDGNKGYYYYDLSGSSGDYCFVVSTVSNSGATAARTPIVGGVANAGKYYLSQGNYHGYACMHLWNPAGDAIRLYFTSENAGLNAIPQSEAGSTQPQNPTSAQPTSGGSSGGNGGTIYCQNAANWGAVYAYMWNSESDRNAAWPGVKMTSVGNNIYKYDYSKDYANVIFNVGSDATQTDDLVNPGSGKMFNNANGQWSDYSDNPQDPTTSGSSTEKPSTVVPTSTPGPAGSKVVFCEDAANWGSVYAYMWNSESDHNGMWPGVQMTKLGDNIWRYTVPKEYGKIIFNNGSSNLQTTDMSFPGYGYIYNNKTNEWSIYDTSPLQVQNFTTDLAAPQFAGVGITMHASATGIGNVKYKFSVTSSSGSTKVVADYSYNNSALWTPSAAGTYTLVYEFKDSGGNTNKRTLAYKVEDGSASDVPFIKLIKPAAGQQIKKSAACSITVSAGGGNVGTKLLFYKYTVKDSAGKIVNVPYYTTKTSYSFTPTALGTYTVTVSVQASNNETVERICAYDCVNTIVTPTTPTEPDTEPSTIAPPSAGGMLGDADRDGKVTILDATRIQRWLAALVTDADLDKANADTDRDTKITILDATRIQRFLAGMIDEL